MEPLCTTTGIRCACSITKCHKTDRPAFVAPENESPPFVMEQVHCNKITVEQTLDLRHAVLWPDKPLSHVCLPEDASGLHFGAFIADQDVTHQPAEPVAVISLFVERLPIDNNEPCSSQDHGIHSAAPMANRSHVNNENTAAIRFRKFACNPKYQGQGVGSKLLAHALSMASSELGTTIA